MGHNFYGKKKAADLKICGPWLIILNYFKSINVFRFPQARSVSYPQRRMPQQIHADRYTFACQVYHIIESATIYGNVSMIASQMIQLTVTSTVVVRARGEAGSAKCGILTTTFTLT